MSELCRFQLRHRHAILVALLVHLLAIVAMASAPAWHDAVHHDAGSQTHECAVTLFASGGCDDTTVVVLVVELALAVVVRLAPRPVLVEKLFLVLRVLEHAPPTAA